MSNASKRFVWGRKTYVMAILNVTPDSFSGDGLIADRTLNDIVEAAEEQAKQALLDGADILDIGGMSTRPNAPPISPAQEAERALPALRAIVSAFPEAVVSIDTYRSTVAAGAIAGGASVVNSVWGIRQPVEEGRDGSVWNETLIDVVAASDALLVLTHNSRTHAMAGISTFSDIVSAVREDLSAQREYAVHRGINRERLILDPGLGFGKSFEDNLQLLRRLPELGSLGLPILVGASRKSFLGTLLDQIPPEERDIATAATTAWAIPLGADIVRVHNVLMNVTSARIIDALARNRR